MQFFFVFLSAGVSFFLWMYLITYFMHRGVGDRFMAWARIGALRGMIIAWVFLLLQYSSATTSLIYTDWLILPFIFFCIALPSLWKRLHWFSILPFFIAFVIFLYSIGQHIDNVLWAPFHEEIAKWLQSFTMTYPAVMSPFVSIGFSFIENIRYFSENSQISYMLARSLFALPLHLFATFFGLWCFFFFQSRIVWILVGILSAVAIHTLYNWSLNSSIFITLMLITIGYLFYGWSIENGWWKKKV